MRTIIEGRNNCDGMETKSQQDDLAYCGADDLNNNSDGSDEQSSESDRAEEALDGVNDSWLESMPSSSSTMKHLLINGQRSPTDRRHSLSSRLSSLEMPKTLKQQHELLSAAGYCTKPKDGLTDSSGPDSLGAPPASPRPRSCSSAFESFLPMAMVSPLLVASSPLTRSTPSLNSLKDDLLSTYQRHTGGATDTSAANLPRSTFKGFSLFRDDNSHSGPSSLSVKPSSSKLSATPSPRDSDSGQSSMSGGNKSPKVGGFSWSKKTTFRNTPTSSPSEPLAVPRNPFRRASLQPTPSYTVIGPDGYNIAHEDATECSSLQYVPHCERISDITSDIGGDKVSTSAPTSIPTVAVVPPCSQDRDAACPSSQGGADTLSTNNSNPCPSSGGSSSSSSQYEQQGVQPASSKPSSPSKALPPSPGAAGGSPGPHQDSPDSLDTDDEDDCDTLKLTGVDQQSPPLATVICPTVSTHHNGREVINKTYAIPIDSLFTLLFTNSKLMLDVFASRKLLDSKSSPWQSKDDTEQRLRQVTYVATLPTNSFGPKVSHVTETQVMSEYTRPGEYYSVDSEASNAGIPYADSFLVSSHYCLTREGYNETRLAVFTDVKYKKSMWGFMKGIIDKNSFSGVEGLLGDVDIALQQEEARLQSDLKKTTASTTRRRRRRGGSKADAELLATVTAAVTASAGGGGGGAMVGGVSVPVTVVLPTNNSKETTKTSSAINRIIGPAVRGLTPRGSMSSTLLDSTTVGGVRRTSSTPVDETSTGSGWWSTLRVVVVALLLLLLTNCLLYWRLIQLEDIVRDTHHYHHHSMLAVDPSVFRKAGGEAWLHLLQEQEAVHSKQVEGWRDQVSQAASLLQQAESVLRGLHNAIPVQHAAKITELLTKLQSPDTLASLTGQQHLPGHSAPPVHHLNEDQNYLDHSLGTLGEGG